jgi:hypothetical protein
MNNPQVLGRLVGRRIQSRQNYSRYYLVLQYRLGVYSTYGISMYNVKASPVISKSTSRKRYRGVDAGLVDRMYAVNARNEPKAQQESQRGYTRRMVCTEGLG